MKTLQRIGSSLFLILGFCISGVYLYTSITTLVAHFSTFGELIAFCQATNLQLTDQLLQTVTIECFEKILLGSWILFGTLMMFFMFNKVYFPKKAKTETPVELKEEKPTPTPKEEAPVEIAKAEEAVVEEAKPAKQPVLTDEQIENWDAKKAVLLKKD